MSDRLSFNPQARFIKRLSDADRAGYRSTMMLPIVQSAMVEAMAEMTRLGCSREQLDGAITFINLFQNFGESEPKPQTLPIKSLKAP